MVTTLPDWLGQLLFGVRHVRQAEVAVNDSDTINVLAPLTASFNTNTGHVDVGLAGSAAVSVTSLTIGPETWTSGPIVLTTDGSVASLIPTALAIPAAGTLYYRATVEAKILSYGHTVAASWTNWVKWYRNGSAAPTRLASALIAKESAIGSPPFVSIDGPGVSVSISGAADNGSGLIRLTLSGTQTLFSGISGTVSSVGGVPNATGTWGLIVVDTTHVDLVGSTWGGTYTSGGTITFAGTVSQATAVGNAAQIQASGILPPLWVAGEAVNFGTIRYAAASGNTYLYTSSGTTSASPTGTTTFTDSGLTGEWVSAGQRCPVSWQVTDLRYATT